MTEGGFILRRENADPVPLIGKGAAASVRPVPATGLANPLRNQVRSDNCGLRQGLIQQRSGETVLADAIWVVEGIDGNHLTIALEHPIPAAHVIPQALTQLPPLIGAQRPQVVQLLDGAVEIASFRGSISVGGREREDALSKQRQ